MSSDESTRLYYMREFRDHLVRFLDELIEQFPEEGEFVVMRIFIKDQIPIADVIGRFIRDLLPLKASVDARDEKFFLDNTLLIVNSPGGGVADRVDHFRALWLSDRLSDDDRKVMWKWMDVFMHIAGMYHKKFGNVYGWD